MADSIRISNTLLPKDYPLYIWNSNLTRSPAFYLATLVRMDPWAVRALGRGEGRRVASTPYLIYSWWYEIQRNDLRSYSERKTRDRSGWCSIRIHSIQRVRRSILTQNPPGRKEVMDTVWLSTWAGRRQHRGGREGLSLGGGFLDKGAVLKGSRTLLRSGGHQEDRVVVAGHPRQKEQFKYASWFFFIPHC